MLKNILIFICIAILSFFLSQKLVDAGQCTQLAIISQDGYSNVRAQPEVKLNNVVGSLLTGTTIYKIGDSDNWIKISTPFTGWIAKGQVSTVSCEVARKKLITIGIPTIQLLVRKSISGNKSAAEVVFKVARSVDGAVADSYLTEIRQFVNQNPGFFVSALKDEQGATRISVLKILDIGMQNKTERNQFEAFLFKLPCDHLVSQEWKNKYSRQ
jgi:hypothetical protein